VNPIKKIFSTIDEVTETKKKKKQNKKQNLKLTGANRPILSKFIIFDMWAQISPIGFRRVKRFSKRSRSS
jgi:hypothetical protein